MHATHELDRFDLRLLAALEEDGRLTNQQAGERIGLSPSQCSRRRAALEAAGVIRRYRVELAPERIGLRVVVFIQVTLAAHSGDNSRHFRDLIDRLDEVQEAYALTGDADYLLKAIVPDLQGLTALINEALLAHRSIARVRSFIVLDRLKESRHLPLHAVPTSG